MASVTVRTHPERLREVIGGIARDEGLGAFMSTEAAKGMDPYVPYRDGTLAGSADTSRPFHVVYGGAASAYASRVYDGLNMKIHTDKHPKATSRWDRRWFTEHKGQFCRSILGYIESRLT